MAELITMTGVNKKYKNGVTAIYDLDLKIKKGEFVFIIGGSGSGKSTLIKIINVAKLRNSKVYKLRRRLGIVFQDYRLLPKLTVYENVSFALECIGTKPSEIRIKTLRALELVGLKGKIRNYPDELSGGEQQRVAIARAIVNNPKLILCDEPTGNLDPKMSLEIVKVLDEINKTTGTTVIMATHDKEIVNKFKKRVIAIKQGRIVKDYEEGKYDNESI